MLAALVLLAASTSHASSVNGRPYQVVWPEGRPAGIIVFLHGMSRDPLVEEEDGISAIAALATNRGLVAVFPLAGAACPDDQRCWDTDEIAGELKQIDQVVRAVEDTLGQPLTHREIIGFSSGGFLIGGALQRGLLNGYARAGILAGGPVGTSGPPSARGEPPAVYLEVGKNDDSQHDSTLQLARILARAWPKSVGLRENGGGHALDPEDVSQFLMWFWGEG